MSEQHIKWLLCPVCGNKTRLKIRGDTVLENFPLFYPKCKQETLINVKELNILEGRKKNAKVAQKSKGIAKSCSNAVKLGSKTSIKHCNNQRALNPNDSTLFLAEATGPKALSLDLIPLTVNQVIVDNFHRSVLDIVHPTYPFHLVFCF